MALSPLPTFNPTAVSPAGPGDFDAAQAQPNATFADLMNASASSPDAQSVGAPSPVAQNGGGQNGVSQTSGAQTADIVAMPTDRSSNLGQVVLDNLERFGTRVNKLESTAMEKTGKGRSSTAVSLATSPAATSVGTAAGTTGGTTAASAAGGPAKPPSVDLEALYHNSQTEQIKLFSLMIDVTMGHSASSSVNSTMKTLLTQSG